jgi:hypothetical protein
MLGELAPDEEKFYAEGADEGEEEIETMNLMIPAKNRPTTATSGRLRLFGHGSSPLKRELLCVTHQPQADHNEQDRHK